MPDGRQLQLSQQLYHLLKCLDRQRSLSELVDDFQQQTGQKISIEQLTQLLEQVVQPQGLLAGEQSLVKPVSAQPTSALALHLRRDVIPARLLQPLTRVLSVLFAPLVLVGLLPLIAVAHGVTYLTLGVPPKLNAASVPLFWVYVLVIASYLFHELGHLAACQRWKCAHGPLGVGLYFFSPAFYVDVSPAWQLPRWKRAVVDLGGIYFQLLFTILLGVIFWATREALFLWVIVFIDISALMNLDPMIKLDGYWLLSDLAGMPNLHKRSGEMIMYTIALLAHRLGFRKQKPALSPFWQVHRISKVPVFIYAIMSMLLWPLILVVVAPILVQAMTDYPFVWTESFLRLMEALRTLDFSTLGKSASNLLFPILIVVNVGVLAARLLTPVKTFFSRRINMNEKTKWILMGSGLGILIAVVAVGLTLLIVRPNLQASDEFTELSVGQTAPDFTATDIQGNIVRLSDFRGHPVILKFWTPECKPCVLEVADVQEAYQQLKNEYVFLTVGIETPVETLKSFASKKQITYPVLLDEKGQVKNLYGVRHTPYIFLISPDGVIRKTLLGAHTADELKQEIVSCGSACQTP